MKLCIEIGSLSLSLKKYKEETESFLNVLFDNLLVFTNQDIQRQDDLIYLDCDTNLLKHEVLSKVQRLEVFLSDSDLIQDYVILISSLDFRQAATVINQITKLDSIYFQTDIFNLFKDFLYTETQSYICGNSFNKVSIITELIENRSSLFFRLKKLFSLVTNYSFDKNLILTLKYDFFLKIFVQNIYKGYKTKEISLNELLNSKDDNHSNIIYLCKLDDFYDNLPKFENLKVIFYTNRIKDEFFSIASIEEFEKNELLFLYSYILSSLALDHKQIFKIFSESKLFPDYLEYFESVKSLGLLKFSSNLNTDLFLQDIKTRHFDLCRQVQDKIMYKIFDELKEVGFNRNHDYLIYYFSNYFIAKEKHFLILQTIKDCYENYYGIDYINFILNKYYSLVKYADEDERQIVDAVLFISEMNNSLSNGDEVGVAIAFEKLKNIEKLSYEEITNYINLAMSSYHLAYCRYSDAINLSKNVLFFSENIENFDLKSKGQLALGVSKLGEKEIFQALQYFDYALKNGESLYNIFYASYYKAIVLFLLCDFEEVLNLIKEMLERNYFKSVYKAEIILKFLKARTYFELGRYEKSEELFLEISKYMELDYLEKNVCLVWSYRSAIYHKQDATPRTIIKKLEQLEDVPDKFLTLGEYHYFRGKFDQALKAINTGYDKYNLNYMIKFIPTNFLYIKTGYYLFEDKIYKNEDGFGNLGKLFLFFKNYLEVKISKTFDEAQGLDLNISQIISSKTGSLNPMNRIFLYLASESIRYKEDEDSLNRITLLNRSDKMLKDLLATIKSPDIKREFLYHNLWNKLIFSELLKLNQ